MAGRNLILTVSMTLNAVLAGVLLYQSVREPATQVPPAVERTETAAAAPAPVARASDPFRWSQLESSDYRTYVANLRRVGCPEQTIQDIIKADVDELYTRKRRNLEIQQASQPEAVAAGTHELQREERAVLAQLLGGPANSAAEPANNQVASAAAPSSGERLLPARIQRPISMPLVFQPMDPAAVNLTSEQLALVQKLQSDFITEVGAAPGQDPADPAYAERWQKAQPQIDQQLRTMVGWQVYARFQNAAGHWAWDHALNPH